MAILAATWLVPFQLFSQSSEWMLFNPKSAGAPTDGIFHLTVSPDGHIWTACNNIQTLTPYGLAIFDGRNWTVYNTRNSELPSDSAFPLVFDNLGNAWIGTMDFWSADGGSGLVKLNGTNWTVYNKKNSVLPSNNIGAGTIDPAGNLWFATGGGMVRFDGQNWRVWNNTEIGVGNNWLSAIATDQKGNVWVGTYKSGGEVAKYDGQTWTSYKSDASGISPNTGLLNIVFDSRGNTWLSGMHHTSGAAQVVKFDGTFWTIYSNADSTLPGWLGWGLTVDNQDMIWAGGSGVLNYSTGTNGVAKFDGQNWRFYTRDNSGMPARNVYSLAQDSYGNMWMGTEIGLVAYREGGVVFPGVTPILTQNAAVGEAIDAHDVKGIIDCMAPEAVFDFVPAPPVLAGTNAIASFFSGMFQGFPDYTTIAEQRCFSSNVVVTAHVTTGTLQNSWMGMPATGKGGRHMHLDIWEYQGDKIQKVTTYLDLQSLMVVTGLMPAPQLPPLLPTTSVPDSVPVGLSPVAAVIEGQARWNRHDLAGLAKMMRADAQVLFAMLGAPLDRKSAIAVMELFFLGFGDLRIEVVRHLDLGDGWVLSEGIYRGANDGPYFGLPATGRAINVRAAILNQVDSQGLISAMRIYFDNITALTQLGYFPPPSLESKLAINMCAALTIEGTPGKTVTIEYCSALNNVDAWKPLTNFVLPATPFLFVDTNSIGKAKCFYRVLEGH